MWFLRWISKWPWGLLYLLSGVVYFLTYYVVRYRRKVVAANLRKAFPERPNQQLKTIEKQFYRHLSDVLVEIVKALSISKEEMAARVKYTNIEVFESRFKEKKPLLVYAAHQGNWEWLLLGGKAQLPYPCDVIYKPLKSPFSEHFMRQVRERFGGAVIPKNAAVRTIVKTIEQPRLYGIAADQVPGRKANKQWQTFFGINTAFFPGIEQLPKLTNLEAVFLKMTKVGRGYYEVEAIPMAAPPYARNSTNILPVYSRIAEQMILEQPAYWLWSHKRWKYPKKE